ncbi:phosphate acetyltransferase [Rhizobium sp. L1K21]|uniref:phosphate acetyltransferase n=1 Tax=Rhizobium sp. L1K21 TaxID=2954933 RepID=UPI002092AA2B|nr:phosphate acetyltransferase [Rhizobium sp. L1K21]MCO6188259.1 phosphate acetyltransferase [Rhizobium sp. L1K21]
MKVGDRVEISRVFDEAALKGFEALTGVKLAHVPEPLIAGMISYLLGVKLPGPGTNYLKQELRYAGKAMPGEALTASVEITRLRPEKHLVDLRALCVNAAGEVICEGRSLVLARDVGA